MKSIAYFVSPHGFGHAARSSALMSALHSLDPDICFEIYTLIPEWFFLESLVCPFHYHSLKTDIGLIQKSPLSEDPEATLNALDEFFPFSQQHITEIAQNLTGSSCLYAISDISPLGLLAGKTASIPTVLIENFTWDWIYENYLDKLPGFLKHIRYLGQLFQSPDIHITTEPYCQFDASADFIARPISRAPKKDRKSIRNALGIFECEKMILITMGGIQESFRHLDHLHGFKDSVFVIPGGSKDFVRKENLILLPHHSDFYHPDLINACDAAVGKAGYSTISELYNTGTPFGYFSRDTFRESAHLTAFIDANMPSIHLHSKNISNYEWLKHIPDLLALPPVDRIKPNGAFQVAEFLMGEFE